MRYNSPDDVELPDPYGVEDNCLGYYVLKKNNEHFIELCNFVPYISSQVSSYNGYETNTKVKIEGFDSKGNPLPEIFVTNDEFDKLNWVRQHWGFNCNIVPGNGIRDRIRFAIQATSKYAPKTEDYSTTGWHKKDGQYIFLMPGDDANNVQLDGKLQFYEFSRRELTGKEYADIFMLIGNVAPNEIMQPLLSFAFLSPLNSFMRKAQCEPKTVLLLHGKTGSKKSTLAALTCSFFGRFSNTDLPLSFRDTANSLIYNTGSLKDVLTVIDDFHPSQKSDEYTMTGTMQILLRAYGNRCGRQRLTSKSLPMQTRYPKGNAIITAEFLPDVGESGTARYIPLEITPSSIDNEMLTYYQRYASDGTLSACMFNYTEWLKEKYLNDENEFVKMLGDKFINTRKSLNKLLTEKGLHIRDRLIDDLVSMYLGYDFMLDFFIDKKACDKESKGNFMGMFIDILLTIAVKREAQTTVDQPSHKFIFKLIAMLESERVNLRKKDTMFDDYTPVNCIGYEDEEYYYLHSALAQKEVRRFCNEQGESFSISEKALLKALDSEQLLVKSNDGKNTVQHNFGGRNRRYLVIPKKKAREIYDEAN